MKRLTGLLLLVILNIGCATIITSKHQTVYVDSDPKGASVFSNKLERDAITPTSFSFKKGENVYFDFLKNGYFNQSVTLERGIAPAFWMNLLWGAYAPIPMLIDNISGAMWDYKGAVHAKLEKKAETEPTAEVSLDQNVRVKTSSTKKRIHEKGAFGIRLGFGYFSPKFIKTLEDPNDREISPLVSQFGLQFEKTIFTEANRPLVVLQLIPMIAGLDQDVAITTVSGIIGIRTKKGLELGMGPTVLDSGGTSVAYTIGFTREYEGMDIPFTLMAIPSRDGLQTSLLTGFLW